MREIHMKLFFFCTLARGVSTAIFIGSAWAYWSLFNKEAWPVIIPAFFAALIAEALILFLALQAKQGRMRPFLKIILAIIASWVGGLVCFFALDGVNKLLYYQTPKIAWLAALLISVFIMYFLDKKQSNR